MRQYRGLTKDGKWVYGWYVKDIGGKCYIVKDGFCLEKQLPGYASYGIFDYTRVIPETVGQQIGIKSKNDKEIYEGDKLKSGKRILTVMWDGENMQWKAKEDGYHYLTPLCQWAISEQFEIIHPKLSENQ